MRLILRPSISHFILVVLAITVVMPGFAEDAPVGQSQAQKLNWPRTFSGQPDFAFTRDEALMEARTSAVRANKPMPAAATLMDVFSDDMVLDPLGLLVVSQTVVDASGTMPEGEDASGTVPTVTLMQRMMAAAMGLPVVSDTLPTDVSEFRFGLISTLSSTLAHWKPTLGVSHTDTPVFGGVIDTLTLQAVVTSPVKYAVINQQRYTEGDSFLVQMPMQVPDTAIMGALDRRMPPSGTLPAPTLAQFQQVYDGVLSGFYAARRKDPTLGSKTLTVPVVVKAIEPRRVVLGVNGEVHDLAVRFVY